jgi:hypothetical protein
MRLLELRRTLLELVVAAAPAVGAGGLAGCSLFDGDGGSTPPDAACTEVRTLMTRIPEPPPMMQEVLVRACEADPARCMELCSSLLQFETIFTCQVVHDATGHDVTITYLGYLGNEGCPVPGRRPAGLARARGGWRGGARRSGGAAAYLARAAWLEGASVHAFVGLARELTRHGAPRGLCEAARRAAADEVRHAAVMGALARARGAVPPAVEVAPPRRRSLEGIAIENAVEGVVGETWAALVATWQGQHAGDGELRGAFAAIAADEARHAAIAREVDDFCAERLAPAARRRVDAARRRAIARIARGARSAGGGAPGREVGLPGAAATRRLLDGARARLWA